MAEVDEPIIRGALYEDDHGEPIRVRNVWVDENMATQVSVELEDTIGEEERETMLLQSFVEEINNSLFRANSDHDAWEWREYVSER
jgi:hypothetical protein